MEETAHIPRRRYRTCLEVDAIQVGSIPWSHIAEWCGGETIRSDISYRIVGIWLRDGTRANPGDWICRLHNPASFSSWTVIGDEQFRATYTPVD